MKKFIKKLHLWLSLPFGIVISILCLTGALLVFEQEIQNIMYPSRYNVSEVKEAPIALPELVRIVAQQLPDTVTVSGITIPSGKTKNFRVSLAGQGRRTIYVDPYTGEIKGETIPYAKGNFFSTVRRLHRWFLFQMKRDGISWGKLITGTSTLMFLFILLSGVVIWFPKSLKSLKRRLSIKFNGGRFRFWYDLHLAGGMYTLIFLLLFCLTGLTWSFQWYQKGFYKLFGVEVTQRAGHGAPTATPAVPDRGERSGSTTTDENRGSGERGENRERGNRPEGENRRNRSDENREAPTGRGGENRERGSQERENGNQRAEQENNSGRTKQVNYAYWPVVAEQLKKENPKFKTIAIQDGTATVSNNRMGNVRASDRYTFNPGNGEITGAQLYKDTNRSTKIRGWIYSVHVGSWGGMFTRILSFIACLIGTALPLTGYYFFIKRKLRESRKKQ